MAKQICMTNETKTNETNAVSWNSCFTIQI